MESRGNRLGLIAVGLSLLALLVAFSGRASSPRISIEMPQAPVAPSRPDVAPAAPAAPQPDGRAQDRRGWGGPGAHGPWERQADGRHHHVGPLFFLGGLFRTLVGLSLIGLGLRWLRNRRGRGGSGGPGGRGPGGWRGRGPWGGRGGPGGPGGWRGPGPEYQGGPYQSDGPQVTHL